MLDEVVFNFVGSRQGAKDATRRAPVPRVPWTCGDAFQGTQIFGGTGSGKTSTSGRRFAIGLLRVNRHVPQHSFGGLVLTAKEDDLDLWVRSGKGHSGFVTAAGRPLTDVVVFGQNRRKYVELGLTQSDQTPAFNFLEYERELYRNLKFPPTPNLVGTLLTAMSAGADRGQASDPYWDEAVRQLLMNAVDLVDLSDAPLSLETINSVVHSAPQSPAELSSITWRKGLCAELLKAASGRRDLPDDRSNDLCQTIRYWCQEYPSLASRTRSIVVSAFTARAAPLLRSPFSQMFSGTTTITPNMTHQGKVVILDLPIKIYGEAGRVAQLLFKTVWQKATEWRDLVTNPNPVFLWADEAQYFVTPHDVAFQQTARSQRAAVVYLTQNLPNYQVAFGERDGRARTDSLMACLQTKVFHANSDVVTNEWAQRLFGSKKISRSSYNASSSDRRQEPGTDQSRSFGIQEGMEPLVAADRFARLMPASANQPAEAFVFVLGKLWDADRQLLGRKERFFRDAQAQPGVLPS